MKLHALDRNTSFLIAIIAIVGIIFDARVGLAQQDPGAEKAVNADPYGLNEKPEVAKGIGVGRLETAWGLYLFTACILASLWISWRTEQLLKSL